jgi:RES domain-containing protein
MRLWRLSSRQFAEAMDGGYGLLFNGRWNIIGRPVTYTATSPSLCVLEKLFHVEDSGLLPTLAMVAYDVPDETPSAQRALSDLPDDWRRREADTQRMGDEWLAGLEHALLFVPSAIVPVVGSPDWNVIVNHRHPAAATIRIERIEPFELDVQLLG